MTDAIREIRFSDDPENEDRDPEDLAPVQPTGGGPAKPHKPFPLGKLMGGIGAVAVVLVVGSVGLVKVLQPKPQSDQFTNVPQPQMSAGVSAQSAIVQIGAPCAPNGLMGQSPVGVAYCQGGMWTSTAQGHSGGQQGAPMQPPLPQGQYLQPQPQSMAAQSQQSVTAAQNAGVAGQLAVQNGGDPNPMGPVPHRTVGGAEMASAKTEAPGGQQRVATATGPDQTQQAASGDIAAQLAAMQATIADLQKQLAGKNGRAAPKSANHPTKSVKKSAPIQTAAAEDAEQADGDAGAAPAPHHERVVRMKAHTKKAATTGDKGKPDTSYVVTGMIGTRAFITKKGGNDVNPDSTVAVGDTLDDGRKVLSVDPKTKRVWLSGNQYISTGGAGSDE
ncbi:hypothetical protein [Burkholderia sp. Tr-20390]|uniref:hypothetical protein n=1 Tax=Burkholderia sp. Tr-20390 TaxID=2703904 RepID=UPI00197FFEDA|nr:hypothetical protein [Burkholderia sp. Tr-20390]MBN3729361.1 hypothetical protein [Burkholderia sp. Tr-20390]